MLSFILPSLSLSYRVVYYLVEVQHHRNMCPELNVCPHIYIYITFTSKYTLRSPIICIGAGPFKRSSVRPVRVIFIYVSHAFSLSLCVFVYTVQKKNKTKTKRFSYFFWKINATTSILAVTWIIFYKKKTWDFVCLFYFCIISQMKIRWKKTKPVD